MPLQKTDDVFQLYLTLLHLWYTIGSELTMHTNNDIEFMWIFQCLSDDCLEWFKKKCATYIFSKGTKFWPVYKIKVILKPKKDFKDSLFTSQ